MEAWLSSDDSGLRHGDGMADAAEGVVAAIATAGGDDEVVFAAGDWVVKDDFGGDMSWRDRVLQLRRSILAFRFSLSLRVGKGGCGGRAKMILYQPSVKWL